MIKIAKTRATERSIENIHFSNLSIFDDGCKRNSFDMALSFSVLHLLGDVEGILLRINEIVRPAVWPYMCYEAFVFLLHCAPLLHSSIVLIESRFNTS
jgi:hypothetical protein